MTENKFSVHLFLVILVSVIILCVMCNSHHWMVIREWISLYSVKSCLFGVSFILW